MRACISCIHEGALLGSCGKFLPCWRRAGAATGA
uniref:Uncharacterized protein n=1 Tax=Arundo donax TaxID=35708 RepID=A0A0A8Z690_ARUDO